MRSNVGPMRSNVVQRIISFYSEDWNHTLKKHIIFRLLIKQLVIYFHETISFLGHSKTNPMKHYVLQIIHAIRVEIKFYSSLGRPYNITNYQPSL